MVLIREEERERFILTYSENDVMIKKVSKINNKISKLIKKKAKLDRKIYKLTQKRDGLKSGE